MSDPSKITPEHIEQANANLRRPPFTPAGRFDAVVVIVMLSLANLLLLEFGVAVFAGWDYAGRVLSGLGVALSIVAWIYMVIMMFRKRQT